jgi:hypothetical protein
VSETNAQDANLSPDARAIVRELRRLADVQERLVTALEQIAEGVNPPGERSLSERLADVSWNVARLVDK